jgi:hypothetical protein
MPISLKNFASKISQAHCYSKLYRIAAPQFMKRRILVDSSAARTGAGFWVLGFWFWVLGFEL